MASVRGLSMSVWNAVYHEGRFWLREDDVAREVRRVLEQEGATLTVDPEVRFGANGMGRVVAHIFHGREVVEIAADFRFMRPIPVLVH